MDFRLKKVATEYDIPIVHVSTVSVGPKNIMQIQDFSSSVDGNPSAAFRTINTYPNSSGRLSSGNYFGKVMVTDLYHEDIDTGYRTPLWYSHPLRKVYYSTVVADRSVTRKVRASMATTDRVITSLIPTSGSYVIVTDSVRVYTKDTAGSSYVEASLNDFYVSYANGAVVLGIGALTYGDSYIYSFRVDYKLAPIDIEVIGVEDTPYRIELSQVDSTSSLYYNAYILSPDNEQLLVRYRSRIDTGSIIETEEYTVATPVYAETTSAAVESILASPSSYDVLARRVFSLSGPNIYVAVNNTEHLFSYKPKWPARNKIMVKKPYLVDFISDWHLRISAGEITTASNSYILEAQKSTIDIHEIALVLDKRTLSVSGTDLSVSVDENGDWSGITVTKEATSTSVSIDAVDVKNGIIRLSSDVSRKDIITVDYTIHTNDFILEYPCFNPMPSHSEHNEQAGERAAIICIIDSRYVPEDRDSPIYIKYVDMPSVNTPVVYSYTQLDSWFNSATASIRNAYRDGMGLPDSLLGSTLVRIEPLAIVQVLNPLDSDAYEVTDMRTYGGGYSTKQYSYHDYSHYDGEGTDLESMLVIEIPQWIKDELKARAQLWDIDVRKSDEDDRESHAEARAMELIREKVKKYSMLGTTQEIVIGTKTITDNS